MCVCVCVWGGGDIYGVWGGGGGVVHGTNISEHV